MSIDYESDSPSAAAPASVVMEQVAQLVKVRNDAELKVARAEEEFKQAKAALYKIECEDIPELLRGAGLTVVVTNDGTKVEIKDEIACSITQANREQAHKWLRDNGYGSIIKTEVVVPFGKDAIDAADELFLLMAAKYPDNGVREDEGVHPQTLKALLKELRAEGKPVDEKLFGIQPYSIAKCTAPKAKKGKL